MQPDDGFLWFASHALEPAWQLLPGGASAEHESEVWQYMGSRRVQDQPLQVRHTFRHRFHPSYHCRVYADVLETDVSCRLVDFRLRD